MITTQKFIWKETIKRNCIHAADALDIHFF